MERIPRTAWLSEASARWLEANPRVDFDALVERALGAARSGKDSPRPRRALLLAAGASPGLPRLTRDRPAPLLPLGDGTVLDRQLELLRGAGVDEVAVVRGHAGDAWARPELRYIENPGFREEGPLGSLLAARAWLAEPTLVLYGDVLVSERILAAVADAEGDLVLGVDPGGLPDDRAREWVECAGEDCRSIRFDRAAPAGAAEFVGLWKIRPEAAVRWFDLLGREKEDPKRLRIAQGISLYLAAGAPVRAVSAPNAWIHLDRVEDLEEAWIRLGRG